MRIIEVTDPKTHRDFLNTARILYRKDPFWVCPLDTFVEDTFNPLKNNYFSQGDARRWILKNDDGNLIGRIAAFYYSLIQIRTNSLPGESAGSNASMIRTPLISFLILRKSGSIKKVFRLWMDP